MGATPVAEPDQFTDTVDVEEDIVIDLREAAPLWTPHRALLSGRPGILSATKWELAIKRLVDIGMALFFIAAFLPVMLITAAAVKLSSPGPVLLHPGSGWSDGRHFRFAKFRSMFNGAHEGAAPC